MNSKNITSVEKIRNFTINNSDGIDNKDKDNGQLDEDLDEKIYESSVGEKNREINFVNKCFDFNNDDDSNDIADEYVIYIYFLFFFILVDLRGGEN